MIYSDAGFILSEYLNTEYHVMQFTGLKDKNDKEIYEGDLIKLGEIYGNKIIYVEWNNDLACYTMNGKASFDICESHHGEIVGNIYENPELLEDKK